ncbi:MAG: InlB B-repeat-containing protein, partial [Candidatus Brocadiia bacterium]
QTTGKTITFRMPEKAVTAEAVYTANIYTLDVSALSTNPGDLALTGVNISSSIVAERGPTTYSLSVAYEGTVNLVAPTPDPTGYTFLYWVVNGAEQTTGKNVTFTMPAAATTAAAWYMPNNYALAVNSTPLTGLVIGSSTSEGGTTNYTASVPYESKVNLQAPTPDPTGYTFEHWVVNNTTKTAGLRSITFTMSPAAAGTATAVYKANTGTLGAQPVLPTGSSARSITDPAAAGTLTVQSAPPTGLSISSTTGDGGTTNYTLSSVAQGTSVDLQAPETDPAGYSFLQWTVDGVAQTAGQKAVTFTMTAAATAVAQYTPNRCALAVQSAPPTGVVITSSTADGGLTNYAASGVEYGTSVTLQAPATDPVGYTFLGWTLNGKAQTAGQKSITFTVSAAATAVAQYTANTYTLTVQSPAATGIVITSSTADGGATNYSAPGIAYGTIVNLAAPATDPAGYTFSQWTLNGTARAGGPQSIAFATSANMKSITFAMSADITAVAQYTLNAPAP